MITFIQVISTNGDCSRHSEDGNSIACMEPPGPMQSTLQSSGEKKRYEVLALHNTRPRYKSIIKRYTEDNY